MNRAATPPYAKRIVIIPIALGLVLMALWLRHWGTNAGAGVGADPSGTNLTRVYRVDTNAINPGLVVKPVAEVSYSMRFPQMISNGTSLNYAASGAVWMRDTVAAEQAKHPPIRNAIYNHVPDTLKGFTENLLGSVGFPIDTNWTGKMQFFYNDRKGLLLIKGNAENLKWFESRLPSLKWGAVLDTNLTREWSSDPATPVRRNR